MIAVPMLLAPRDVARRLGVTTSRVIQLDREGALRAIRDSAGRRLFRSHAVERFVRKRETRKRVTAQASPER